MSATHRAPWDGKSSAREGAAQVVLGVAVAPGKMRTCQLNHSADLIRRSASGEQCGMIRRYSDRLLCGIAVRNSTGGIVVLQGIGVVQAGQDVGAADFNGDGRLDFAQGYAVEGQVPLLTV